MRWADLRVRLLLRLVSSPRVVRALLLGFVLSSALGSPSVVYVTIRVLSWLAPVLLGSSRVASCTVALGRQVIVTFTPCVIARGRELTAPGRLMISSIWLRPESPFSTAWTVPLLRPNGPLHRAPLLRLRVRVRRVSPFMLRLIYMLTLLGATTAFFATKAPWLLWVWRSLDVCVVFIP